MEDLDQFLDLDSGTRIFVDVDLGRFLLIIILSRAVSGVLTGFRASAGKNYIEIKIFKTRKVRVVLIVKSVSKYNPKCFKSLSKTLNALQS